MTFNVTVNGIAVEKIVDEMIRVEATAHRNAEVKQMSIISSRSRTRSKSTVRNHSGSRSGRVRILFHASRTPRLGVAI